MVDTKHAIEIYLRLSGWEQKTLAQVAPKAIGIAAWVQNNRMVDRLQPLIGEQLITGPCSTSGVYLATGLAGANQTIQIATHSTSWFKFILTPLGKQVVKVARINADFEKALR